MNVFWSHLLGLTQQGPAPNTGIRSEIPASLIQKKYQHRIWFCYFLFSKSSNFGRKPTYLRQTRVFPTYSLYEVKEKRYEVIILLSLIPLLFRRVSGDCRLQQFLMHHLCYSINVVQCWKRRSCSLPIPS